MVKRLAKISSWPPRDCGIATFAEEAVKYGIRPNLPDYEIHVLCHKDGKPKNSEYVHPILDPSNRTWWESVADKVSELNPEVVHIQHEGGLYNHEHKRGRCDKNRGLLDLLLILRERGYPTIVEPHTVHERPNSEETEFLAELAQKSSVLILKEPYLRMRLVRWVLEDQGFDDNPQNIAVIRHGAPVGYANQYNRKQVLNEFGLDYLRDKKIAMLVGWIQKNKQWDIVLERWYDIIGNIEERGGNPDEWALLAAGKLRDVASHGAAYKNYRRLLRNLRKEGMPCFYKRFTPRDDQYYKIVSLADIVLLPSIDETQSGTLARIIALNKPYVTLPVEGLGLQTYESQGGLLALDEESLVDRIADLATQPKKRKTLSRNSAKYLDTRVGWHVVGRLYAHAYDIAKQALNKHEKVVISKDSPLYEGHF